MISAGYFISLTSINGVPSSSKNFAVYFFLAASGRARVTLPLFDVNTYGDTLYTSLISGGGLFSLASFAIKGLIRMVSAWTNKIVSLVLFNMESLNSRSILAGSGVSEESFPFMKIIFSTSTFGGSFIFEGLDTLGFSFVAFSSR